MYGLNAVALLCFGTLNLLAVRLCKCSPRVRKAALHCLCAVLLAGNLLRYCPLPGSAPKIPVEFSTVSYFIVPVVQLAGWKGGKSWAAYAGLMAGFCYYSTMIAAGGPIYCSTSPGEIYISLFCHGTVYLYGFVTISTERCSRTDWYKLVLGTAGIVARALILRPVAAGHGRIFLYELLDAVYLRQLLPAAYWPAAVPVYYLVFSILLLCSMFLFFRCNSYRLRKYRP